MIYRTLEREELELTQLSQSHKGLLDEAYRLYQKESFLYLHNTVFESTFLKRMGAKPHSNNNHYVDGDLVKTPIFRIIIDLIDRKAIESGLLGLGENSDIDFSGNKKNLEDFLRM